MWIKHYKLETRARARINLKLRKWHYSDDGERTLCGIYFAYEPHRWLERNDDPPPALQNQCGNCRRIREHDK